LQLLRLLHSPVRVTTTVWDEVQRDPTKPGADRLVEARHQGLLAIVDEGDESAYPQLDEGESSVLSAAAASRGIAIIDERKARHLLTTDTDLRQSIRASIGIVGLLVLAKRRGLISAVKPPLDELSSQGFHMSARLLREALDAAGETE
jgi:uncharacterized protein